VCFVQICSPTALANRETERRLRSAAAATKHGLYIPSGALWGADDINKMADMGTLQVSLDNNLFWNGIFYLNFPKDVLLFIPVL